MNNHDLFVLLLSRIKKVYLIQQEYLQECDDRVRPPSQRKDWIILCLISIERELVEYLHIDKSIEEFEVEQSSKSSIWIAVCKFYRYVYMDFNCTFFQLSNSYSENWKLNLKTFTSLYVCKF